MKKRIVIMVFGLLMVLLTACGSNKPKINEKPYEDKQFLMGTYVQMRIYDDGKEAALKPAFKRVKELADKITVNQEGSEIDAVNKEAGVKPVKVTDDMFFLLKLINIAKIQKADSTWRLVQLHRCGGLVSPMRVSRLKMRLIKP